MQIILAPFKFIVWLLSKFSILGTLNILKSLGLATLSLGVTGVAGTITYQTLNNPIVILEPLKVPTSLEELGYSSETSTQRFLDELAQLNNESTSAKDRTKFEDAKLAELAGKTNVNIAGMDLQTIQSLILHLINKPVPSITGDISIRKEGKEDEVRVFYHLRIRKGPSRQILVDVEAPDSLEDMFKMGALALMEKIDPMIAASIYGRRMDEKKAVLLVQKILKTDAKDHFKFAINLKANLENRNELYKEALESAEAALKIDPKFVFALNSKAIALTRLKRFDEADVVINLIEKTPNFNRLAQLHRGYTLFEKDKQEEGKAILLSDFTRPNQSAFNLALSARYLNKAGFNDDALKFYRAIRIVDPLNFGSYYGAAVVLKKLKKPQEALNELKLGMKIPHSFQMSLLLTELIYDVGDKKLAKKHFIEAKEKSLNALNISDEHQKTFTRFNKIFKI